MKERDVDSVAVALSVLFQVSIQVTADPGRVTELLAELLPVKHYFARYGSCIRFKLQIFLP